MLQSRLVAGSAHSTDDGQLALHGALTVDSWFTLVDPQTSQAAVSVLPACINFSRQSCWSAVTGLAKPLTEYVVGTAHAVLRLLISTPAQHILCSQDLSLKSVSEQS